MSEPYKIIEQRQYTEVVYYDGDGEEVARDTLLDDHLYDASGQHPVTPDELEDFYPEEDS